MKIAIVMLCSDVLKDRFMHAADMFEPWKALVEMPLLLSGEIKPGENMESCISKCMKAINDGGKYRVIAAFSPMAADGAYCDRSIIMISNGKSLGKFYDWLASANYIGKMPRRYPNEKLIE